MSRGVQSLLALTRDEIRTLARSAVSARDPTALAGSVVAVLDMGPSTLPPAAWAAAASAVGAGVIRREDLWDGGGDGLDVCREAARWADVLVVSHPLTGFARAAEAVTGRAVINGGEGDGEDPAAGISLLAGAFGSRRAWAHPPRVAVCGDLLRSRSARGLLAGLAALEATVLLVPARGCELPEPALQRLARSMGRRPARFEAKSMRSLLDMVDTVLLAREETPQLPLFKEVGVPPGEAARRVRRQVEDLDFLFVAGTGEAPDRWVQEPFRKKGSRARVPEGAEHRTARGALEALLVFALGAREPERETPEGRGALGSYRSREGVACREPGCVASRIPDDAPPDFILVEERPHVLECLYCGGRTGVELAASRVARRFHPVGAGDAAKILPENLVLLRSVEEAQDLGFERSRRRGPAGRTPGPLRGT